MEPFIGVDSVGPSTRTQWFVDLSTEITARGLDYEIYLDARWNPLFIPYGKPPNIEWKLNPLAVPVRVWSKQPVWFEPEFLTFYEYDPATGAWRPQLEESVKRRVTEFLIPMAPGNPVFLPANQVVGGIVKSLKVLGLRESTTLAEQPLHFGNTMLFLKNRVMAPFSPAYYSRKRIAIEYKKKHTGMTAFRSFLQDALDADDIELLRLWSGMVLLNRNPFHKIMILSGAAGSGKSTFIDILERILGSENVATLVVDRLEDRFELAEFFGKTLLVAKDVSSDFLKSKKVHMLKSLSGDKHIKAEIKFSNNRVMLEGPFNIAMTSNSTLNISLQGDMDAWKRRLLIIKFDPAARVAAGRSPIRVNTKLVDQLIDNESSGILNWMLSGAEDILAAEKMRLPFPLRPSHVARVASLLTSSDALTTFLREKVKPSPGGSLTTTVLYTAYEDFCATIGVFPVPKPVFERRICPLLYELYKSTPGTISGIAAGGGRLRGYRDISL